MFFLMSRHSRDGPRGRDHAGNGAFPLTDFPLGHSEVSIQEWSHLSQGDDSEDIQRSPWQPRAVHGLVCNPPSRFPSVPAGSIHQMSPLKESKEPRLHFSSDMRLLHPPGGGGGWGGWGGSGWLFIMWLISFSPHCDFARVPTFVSPYFAVHSRCSS